MSEVRSSIIKQNYFVINNIEKNKHDIPVVGCSSSINISFNENDTFNMRHNVEEDELSSSSSSSSSYISDASNLSSFSSINSSESFRECLASCFVNNNINHVQGNSILSVLRTHPCFSNLPKDVRTLLNTPQYPAFISNVEPGEYIHFDLEVKLVENLFDIPFISTLKELELDFNTDGCNLNKSGTVHIWPIQCRIVNLQRTKPIVIGIYKGLHKPHDPNTFFEKFVADILRIISNGGIIYRGNKIPIRLRCFIADAPARAFILNHRSHVSSQPCSKCKVSGIYTEGRIVFSGINHILRTDEEYIRCSDADHHKEGKSSLSSLPMSMVS